MIWTHGEEHIKTFIGYLNSIHPSIKFTHEYFNSLHQTLPFLDVQVHLINNHIQTDFHTEPTDNRFSYKPTTLSLTNEAENSSSTLPNIVIHVAAPHYKEMRIVFAQFHVTQPSNRRNRYPPSLTEHPLSHPSTLRLPKYHLLSTSMPLSFNSLPTAKKHSPTHQL